jgi:uncharacterized SAM-binding protein YcdF (DUF218 family)
VRRWFRWPVRLAAAIGFLWLAVTFTPLVFWWGTALAGPWRDPQGETLVVLSGSAMGSEIMGASTYWRCVYALLVYREGGVRQIVVSGGGEAGRPVAEIMRDYLEGNGVPRGTVVVEPRARSTRESALFLRPILQGLPGRVVLLSSDYHMFRATRAFHQAGVDVLPRPIPDARKRASSWNSRWDAFQDLLIETTRIGYYFLRGWI